MPDDRTTDDLVERALAMFAAGDRGDIDATIAFFAPDVVWEIVGSGMRIEGAVALHDFMQDWFDRYEDYAWTVEEALDMGNDVVLIVYLDSGRPGGSTFSVRERGVVVIEWTSGLIVRVTDYDDDQIEKARAVAERLAREKSGG